MVAAARSSTAALEAITWERVRFATQSDPDLQALTQVIVSGFPDSIDGLPDPLRPFWPHCEELTLVDGVIMKADRIVVPLSLRPDTLRALHVAHQGVSRMASRAQRVIFWPGMSSDITRTRATCHECWRIAPSQPSTPPATPQVPSHPFQAVAADFFSLRGAGYLVIVDRFSGWPHIVASVSGAHGFCRALLSYFSTFGVPEELSTDGGPEFTASETAVLLGRWGVRHRLSSAYHPQSNGRAEVAVKFMKRLLLTHVNADGEFHTDAVAAGLLQYRNTPDPETGLSPAQVVFGRSVRDLLPITPEATIFESPTVHPVWRDTWACQEQAMRLRFARQTDVLGERSRPLPSLSPGATVLIQNQTGQHPKRWDRTGSVIEARAHDQYVVKVHGSGRVTLRNRRFLRPITGLLPFERPPPPPPSRLAQSPVPPPSPAPDDAAPATTGPAAPSSTSPRSGSAAPTPIGTDSAAPASPVPSAVDPQPHGPTAVEITPPRPTDGTGAPPRPDVLGEHPDPGDETPPAPQLGTTPDCLRRGQRTRRAPKYLDAYLRY